MLFRRLIDREQPGSFVCSVQTVRDVRILFREGDVERRSDREQNRELIGDFPRDLFDFAPAFVERLRDERATAILDGLVHAL